MSAVPVIVPVSVHSTRRVNCIVEQGVRYCESAPVTREDGIFLSAFVIGLTIFMAGFAWLCSKEVPGWVLFGYFIAPFAVILLILL